MHYSYTSLSSPSRHSALSLSLAVVSTYNRVTGALHEQGTVQALGQVVILVHLYSTIRLQLIHYSSTVLGPSSSTVYVHGALQGQHIKGQIVNTEGGTKVLQVLLLGGVVQSHIVEYPVPSSIHLLWGIGLLLGISWVLQCLSGLLITYHYSSYSVYAWITTINITRDVYYGYCIRGVHTTIVTLLFVLLHIHILKGMLYRTNCTNAWNVGILLYVCSMGIAFLGYILPWGNMSYWGATVITNLLSIVPSFTEWLLGDYSVSKSTICRFYSIHYLLPWVCLGLVVMHLYYLHSVGSSSPVGYSTNHRIPFTPFSVGMDAYGLLAVYTVVGVQVYYNTLTLVHPDNTTIVQPLVTPNHIVPEWYFLALYGALKAIPNKVAGFLTLVNALLLVIVYGKVCK